MMQLKKFIAIQWIGMGTVLVSACAPIIEPPLPTLEAAPLSDPDNGPDPDAQDVHTGNESDCLPSYREQKFMAQTLSDEEINAISTPLHKDEYPVLSGDEYNDTINKKNIPYNRNVQYAFKFNLSSYVHPSGAETLRAIRIYIPSLTKYKKSNHEFICALESKSCSGLFTRKHRKQLNPEFWGDDAENKAQSVNTYFSMLFFADVGAWRRLGIDHWSRIYEKKKLEFPIYQMGKTEILPPSALTLNQLTFVVGTRSYFPLKDVKLSVTSTYCKK